MERNRGEVYHHCQLCGVQNVFLSVSHHCQSMSHHWQHVVGMETNRHEVKRHCQLSGVICIVQSMFLSVSRHCQSMSRHCQRVVMVHCIVELSRQCLVHCQHHSPQGQFLVWSVCLSHSPKVSYQYV